jgi:hypothetical protein
VSLKLIQGHSNFSVRLIQKKDLPDVLMLMQLIQPHLNRSIDLLDWEYFQSPGENSKIYSIWDQDKLVAIYGAVSLKLRCNDKVHTTKKIQDVMTHPDYRGRGFLHHLASICFAELKKKCESGYTLPNEQSHNSFLRTGWVALGDVPARAIDLDSTVDSKTRRLEMVEVDLSDDSLIREFEEIWLEAGFLYGIERDQQFILWRYSKPGQSYRLYTVRNEGFLVLKFYKDDDSVLIRAHICDLVFKLHSMDKVEDAIHFARRVALDHGANQLTAWGFEDSLYASQFDNCQLIRNRSTKRTLFVLPIPQIRDGFKDSKNWYLSHGDSDVY